MAATLTFAAAASRAATAARSGLHGVAAAETDCRSSAIVPQYPELLGVQFVSRSTGWVVGSDDILATADGGQHWSLVERTSTTQFSSLDFVDAAHGWVVGTNELLVTDDGGRYWQALAEPCPAIDSVDFVSPLNGFAVAGRSGNPAFPTAVLATVDGGRSWRRLTTPKAPQSVCFHDSQSGWIGADGNIYSTVDGGREWTLTLKSSRYGLSFSGDVVLECAGAQSAWAEIIGPGVGLGHERHIGYHSYGGAWTPIFAEQYTEPPNFPLKVDSPGPYPGPFSAISASAAAFVGYCPACSFGTAPMAIAQDGGAQLYRPGNVGGIDFATGASFITTGQGWVTGVLLHYNLATGAAEAPTYRIVHTADGGRTWHTQYAAR